MGSKECNRSILLISSTLLQLLSESCSLSISKTQRNTDNTLQQIPDLFLLFQSETKRTQLWIFLKKKLLRPKSFQYILIEVTGDTGIIPVGVWDIFLVLISSSKCQNYKSNLGPRVLNSYLLSGMAYYCGGYEIPQQSKHWIMLQQQRLFETLGLNEIVAVYCWILMMD